MILKSHQTRVYISLKLAQHLSFPLSMTSVQFCLLMTYNVELGRSNDIPKRCINATILTPHEMLSDLYNLFK